jgi:hypothetical protein
MSFTYAQLKQAIQDYTDNTETSFINNLPLFIRTAEERILKSVQLSLFRKNVTGLMSSGGKYLACPSDFLAPLSLAFINATGDQTFLDFKNVDYVQTVNPDGSDTGEPRYYAQFDVDYFILAPTPNSAYTAELHYFYRPASLTAGAESGTTWMSENASLSMLYGALVEAYVYMKGDPDMMALYDKRYTESLLGLKLLGEAREVTDEYRTGLVTRTKE